MIADDLLARLKADFDLAALSWGLAAGSGEPIYASGDPVELLHPLGDPSRGDEIVLMTPGEYQFWRPTNHVDLMLDLAAGLQAAAMDLLRRPFPETREGHVLSAARGDDSDLWWMDDDIPFARVGTLSDRDLHIPRPDVPGKVR